MIYRGPDFLAVVLFGSSPTLSPPRSSASCLSFLVFLYVAGRAYWRERGKARSQIIWPRESLVSINHSILSILYSCISSTVRKISDEEQTPLWFPLVKERKRVFSSMHSSTIAKNLCRLAQCVGETHSPKTEPYSEDTRKAIVKDTIPAPARLVGAPRSTKRYFFVQKIGDEGHLSKYSWKSRGLGVFSMNTWKTKSRQKFWIPRVNALKVHKHEIIFHFFLPILICPS